MKRSLAMAALVLAGAVPAAFAQQDPMGLGAPTGAPRAGSPEDILPEVDDEIAGDAAKVFERAEKAYEDRDWLEAIAHYQLVRSKFSFNLPLATKAELRLGDVAFARERWSEARSHYRNFLRFHPKHEQADYAAFRAGLSTYREIPGDSWLFPPSSEKDQTEVKAALSAMRDFVRAYPGSKFDAEAQQVVRECEDKLASHELYVAKFYAKREKWKGALMRAKGVVAKYPSSGHVPEALAICVESHSALGEGEAAKKALEELAARKPDDRLLARATNAARQAK